MHEPQSTRKPLLVRSVVAVARGWRSRQNTRGGGGHGSHNAAWAARLHCGGQRLGRPVDLSMGSGRGQAGRQHHVGGCAQSPWRRRGASVGGAERQSAWLRHSVQAHEGWESCSRQPLLDGTLATGSFPPCTPVVYCELDPLGWARARIVAAAETVARRGGIIESN